MDIKLFAEILRDKHSKNYEKLKYKYSEDFDKFLDTLSSLFYKNLSLVDFSGNPIVYTENYSHFNQNSLKYLLKSQDQKYGITAAEDEIISSAAIENIDFNRDSVRSILKGYAPKDKQEDRIFGVKKGLEFISDIDNKITEENIYTLYQMTVGDFLPEQDKLTDNNYYRTDTVYIVSDHIEHTGIDFRKIPEKIKELIQFINSEDEIEDLIKATIIHFYIAYIHPYFDGNGRMARLVHLWFLIQKGYESALFIPFSSQIMATRNNYYKAFSMIEQNKKYCKKIDITPFIDYFIENVYNKITTLLAPTDTLATYSSCLKKGLITEKETSLWKFVLSQYGNNEFSTKQLEKDFGDAAYATIRSFVIKFENLNLLQSQKYGQRVKYKIFVI